MDPYEPVHSFVGHDTRQVADPRSTDSLINMKLNNAYWVAMSGSNIEQRLLKGQLEENLKRSEATQGSQTPDQQLTPNGNGTQTYNDFSDTHQDNPDDIPVDPALEETSKDFMAMGMGMGLLQDTMAT
jgi:hypothetical protein